MNGRRLNWDKAKWQGRLGLGTTAFEIGNEEDEASPVLRVIPPKPKVLKAKKPKKNPSLPKPTRRLSRMELRARAEIAKKLQLRREGKIP